MKLELTVKTELYQTVVLETEDYDCKTVFDIADIINRIKASPETFIRDFKEEGIETLKESLVFSLKEVK